MTATARPVTAQPAARGFPRRRSGAGRLGPQGNRDRRDRDARPDGDPRGIRAHAAAARRAHRRLAAHDHPDRGADRDAAGAGRRRCAGPPATSSRPRTMPPPPSRRAAPACSPTRARSLDEYWEFTHRIFDWPQGAHANMILDDGGDATLLLHLGARAEKDISVLAKPTSEEEMALFDSIRATLKRDPQLVFDASDGDPRRVRGDHHRRQAPLPDGEGRPARLPGHQRQRLGHQDPSSTICTAAANRWSTASSAPPTS